jgi:hypothetical protein
MATLSLVLELEDDGVGDLDVVALFVLRQDHDVQQLVRVLSSPLLGRRLSHCVLKQASTGLLKL